VSILWIVLALVALQRLAELAYARHNTRILLAEGAYESGAGHYPLLVGLHALWLLSLVLFVPSDADRCDPIVDAFAGGTGDTGLA
jgi:methyltransferase